jgi:hypothetical protein
MGEEPFYHPQPRECFEIPVGTCLHPVAKAWHVINARLRIDGR